MGYQELGRQALLTENDGLRSQVMAAYVGKVAQKVAGRPGAGGLSSAAAP
jgi:hypothetical protein